MGTTLRSITMRTIVTTFVQERAGAKIDLQGNTVLVYERHMTCRIEHYKVDVDQLFDLAEQLGFTDAVHLPGEFFASAP
jgi:hypothetical protein